MVLFRPAVVNHINPLQPITPSHVNTAQGPSSPQNFKKLNLGKRFTSFSSLLYRKFLESRPVPIFLFPQVFFFPHVVVFPRTRPCVNIEEHRLSALSTHTPPVSISPPPTLQTHLVTHAIAWHRISKTLLSEIRAKALFYSTIGKRPARFAISSSYVVKD